MTDEYTRRAESSSSPGGGSTGPPSSGSTAISSGEEARGSNTVTSSVPDGRVVLAGQVGLFALAVYVIYGSLQLRLWTGFGPGPGFFPFVLSIGLAVLCAAWFVQTRRDQSDPYTGEPLGLRNVGVVVLSLVVLAAVMDLLGFQISVFLFLLFHLKWRAHRGWVLSLAISLAGSIGVFTGFTQGLLVGLPQSSIPALSNLGL